MISIIWFTCGSFLLAFGVFSLLIYKTDTVLYGIFARILGSVCSGFAIWLFLNGYQAYKIEQINMMLGG